LGAPVWPEPRTVQSRIGVQLQSTSLFDKLTAYELLILFARFYGRLDGAERAQRALELVGLTGKADAYAEDMSGGQQQRLAIALALVHDPEIVFLDEPTTGLDPQSRRQLWELIEAFKARGRTVMLTTHYMDEAERLCDRLAIVDHGKVIAEGTPPALIAKLGGEHIVEFEIPAGAGVDEAALRALPGVQGYRVVAGATQITVLDPAVSVPALVNLLRDRGVAFSRLTTHHSTLEDVFVNLTGRGLRDA
ncbi:MAG TPA: ATP-binding cassette domain-containing protein, partial [bacterium]|nr:ATP-binding cassette domain-containing protein [bacterium]